MKRSLINRKLGKVERALDKAIGAAEMPGAVVLARMPREGELLEYQWVRGLAVVRPERIPMTTDTIFDLASLTKNMATTTAIDAAAPPRVAQTPAQVPLGTSFDFVCETCIVSMCMKMRWSAASTASPRARRCTWRCATRRRRRRAGSCGCGCAGKRPRQRRQRRRAGRRKRRR